MSPRLLCLAASFQTEPYSADARLHESATWFFPPLHRGELCPPPFDAPGEDAEGTAVWKKKVEKFDGIDGRIMTDMRKTGVHRQDSLPGKPTTRSHLNFLAQEMNPSIVDAHKCQFQRCAALAHPLEK